MTHISYGFNVEDFLKNSGRNDILEGIRGTGKTHILKMLYASYLQSFDKLKILPVYFSISTVSEAQTDINKFRQILYANIVLASIDVIENNKKVFYTNIKTQDSSNTVIERIKKRFFSQVGDKIDVIPW